MNLAALLFATIFFLQACSPVGSRHTSDAALERTFESHQAEFESLCAELDSNPQLMTVFAGDRTDLHERNMSTIERAGLSRGSVKHYEDQLRSLGLRSAIKGGR